VGVIAGVRLPGPAALRARVIFVHEAPPGRAGEPADVRYILEPVVEAVTV
jgi:hypothetical protein